MKRCGFDPARTRRTTRRGRRGRGRRRPSAGVSRAWAILSEAGRRGRDPLYGCRLGVRGPRRLLRPGPLPGQGQEDGAIPTGSTTTKIARAKRAGPRPRRDPHRRRPPAPTARDRCPGRGGGPPVPTSPRSRAAVRGRSCTGGSPARSRPETEAPSLISIGTILRPSTSSRSHLGARPGSARRRPPVGPGGSGRRRRAPRSTSPSKELARFWPRRQLPPGPRRPARWCSSPVSRT